MNPKPQSEEYRAFEALLGTVLSASKADINKRLEQEKAGGPLITASGTVPHSSQLYRDEWVFG
jgi:hypothetical protein